MLYLSTRGGEKNVSFSSAVLNGLANDGGLYVPENFPFLLEVLAKNDFCQNLAHKSV